jgi:ATP-dependent DNA helicase RecG
VHDEPINELSTPAKISTATLAKLAKLGVHHRSDLLLHLPLRYEDETRIATIASLQPGETLQVQGVITHNEVAFRPRRTLVCRLQDETGELYLRFLNFYPSQQKQLAVGQHIRAIGEARLGYYGMEMVHPKCRAANEDTPLNTSFTPVYPTTAGLGQHVLRKLIGNALEVLPLHDTLPAELLHELQLADFAGSLRLLHNPPSDVSANQLEARNHDAWRRIKFDELLAQQLSMRVHHRERGKRRAPTLTAKKSLTQRLLQALPFALTKAQQKVLAEISHDIAQPHPMQRLLLGDVGSGKTIVAALAALQAIENGYQVAFMAPTEILAEQHYLKLREWLLPFGLEPVWLSGSMKKKDKTAAVERIADGTTQIAVGTHALFQASVAFKNLGLVIVDEQHKFGVQQRLALRNKGKTTDTDATAPSSAQEPHQLMMSATPIPRTLAMSYYADLDVSVIDELPPGRTPIVTKLISESRRDEVCERVRAVCAMGAQVYWVCPLIEESETLELQNALETFQTLSATFTELRVGLVHGRLDNVSKAAAMTDFKSGATQLLVATTVIEVGVDVPNASLMVIEHAERMGLAQLHQLRGRVGRGQAQSTCILMFQQPLSELARARLKVIFENTDGFVIAQQDLQLRGPGELLGARQSGVAMLRFADLTADDELLEIARSTADILLHDHPDAARAHLQRWMANKHDYLHV